MPQSSVDALLWVTQGRKMGSWVLSQPWRGVVGPYLGAEPEVLTMGSL